MILCEVCCREFPNQGARVNHGICVLTPDLQEKIRSTYLEGKSLKETARIAGVSKTKAGWVIGKLRSKSEALRVSRCITPVLHSKETKEKMRQRRFSYLKKSKGEKTPFERRWSGEMSNLESWFYDSVIESCNLSKSYFISHEYPEYPYFIDFAFLDIKVAVEIDGPLHLKPNRALHDKKKDEDLLEKGWRVYRIRFDECNENGKQDFLKFLESSNSYRTPVYYENFDFDRWGLYKKKAVRFSNTREQWLTKVKQDNYETIHLPRIKKILENKEILRIQERGWVNRVADLLEMKPQKINGWMKKFCPELLT